MQAKKLMRGEGSLRQSHWEQFSYSTLVCWFDCARFSTQQQDRLKKQNKKRVLDKRRITQAKKPNAVNYFRQRDTDKKTRQMSCYMSAGFICRQSTGVIFISVIFISRAHVKNLVSGTRCSVTVSSDQFCHDWNLRRSMSTQRPLTPPSAPSTQTKTHLMNVLNKKKC